MAVPKTLLERLEAKSFPEPMSGCWIWEGYLHPKTGYAQIYGTIDGVKAHWLAHRASYAAHKGPIPEGMLVCHKCDNRACVNPDHLFLGTHQDNLDDASRKGRLKWKNPERAGLRRGESHPQAKISAADVMAIRSSDISANELAAKFSVSNTHIRRIRNRKVWADL